jgi:hypothetical protein
MTILKQSPTVYVGQSLALRLNFPPYSLLYDKLKQEE